MATTSETKLEHTAPAENEREKEDWQEEHSMKMPEPPGPKTRGTEPSVQMVRSQGDKEERKELANPDRTTKGSERWQGSGSERDTEKEGGSQGGKGGQRTNFSRGEQRSGVRGCEEQR